MSDDLTKRKYVVFDVETGALPDSEIERIAPAFDPDSIKVGNLGLEKSMQKLSVAKENHLTNLKRSAALHAEYSKVLAIGWSSPEVTVLLMGKPEKEMISAFWDATDEDYHAKVNWVGFNVFAFDLPYLIRRSIINGIRVPLGLLPKNNRYWPDHFIDLMQVWQSGDYREMISLDRFSKALGHAGKTGSGARFAKTLAEDEAKAAAYLENDLLLTRKVAESCFLSI